MNMSDLLNESTAVGRNYLYLQSIANERGDI